MNWIDLYIQYKKTGTIGACPCCGKAKIEVDNYKHSITFYCTNCKKFKHYDEVKT